ncbi:hypothetical protein, partial [Rhodococcus sp. A14]|uniref:hypothetical protein n=1 Tax=Rhodococcus sp. A14 TaxID=1194106 RepID=UPI00197CB8EA
MAANAARKISSAASRDPFGQRPTDPAGAFTTASLRRVLITPVGCLEGRGVARAIYWGSSAVRGR